MRLCAGPVGAVISAWPAAGFIVSTEILVGQLRRAGVSPTCEGVLGTVAATVPTDVPGDVPVDVPVTGHVDVPGHGVPPVPAPRVRTVASGRIRRSASGRVSKAPERVFAAELERGELPSLRAIKTRMHVGTDRARFIRDQLAEILREVPEAANHAHGIAPA